LSSEKEAVERAFHEAAGRYFRSLQEADVPEETRERVTEAYGDYAAVLQEAWAVPEIQERALEAYRRYAESMYEAYTSDGLAERATGSYRTYVGALRDTWASVDPETLGPDGLATIAQSVLSVASTAGLWPQQDRSTRWLGDEPKGG